MPVVHRSPEVERAERPSAEVAGEGLALANRENQAAMPTMRAAAGRAETAGAVMRATLPEVAAGPRSVAGTQATSRTRILAAGTPATATAAMKPVAEMGVISGTTIPDAAMRAAAETAMPTTKAGEKAGGEAAPTGRRATHLSQT